MTLADAPIWLSGPVMAVLFLAAVEAGHAIHLWTLRWHAARGEAAGADLSGVGNVVSAALALLGLLIGFTFAMSADRYEGRRQLVIAEANAISTTYLRDRLLDEPERGRLLALIGDYAKSRQAFAAAGTDQRRLDDADARTAALQARVWTETAAALRTPSGAPMTTSVLQTTNEMFDLAASRRAALDARVPPPVFVMLPIFALTAAGILGYGSATGGRRHRLVTGGLFLLVALVIGLIIDLDQPRSGLIAVSQTPLNRTVASILQDLATGRPGA